MEELYITLYGENGEELSYRVERIFGMEGTEQLYCGAVPAHGGETVFLRCELSENGENTEMTIGDILDADEYSRVVAAYIRNELSENEDFITVTDANGTKTNFIAHLIFEDEESNRSYIALQKVEDTGEIADDISLYRFVEKDDAGIIDMIPSDMEYERARNLFMKLIETT